MDQEIKYTGHAGEVKIYDTVRNKFWHFKRNKWSKVPEDIALSLLAKKERLWISKDLIGNILKYDISHDSKYIVIERTYAFGDVIMLVPLLRRLIEERPKWHVTLITSPPMVELFQLNSLAHEVIAKNDPRAQSVKLGVDAIFNLDGVLELDHDPKNKEALMHRVEIMEEQLQLPKLPRTNKRNWELKSRQKDLDKIKNILLTEYINKIES